MLKKITKIICAIIIGVFIAGESYSLVMGPSTFEVRLPPGERAEADYYVQNDTDEEMHVTVEAENWFRDVYDYSKLKIEDWIRSEPAEFDLGPGKIKKVKLYIKAPKDVAGEIVAQIFFSSDLKEKVAQGTGMVKARLGGVLYVAINGTEKIAAEIKKVEVSNMIKDGKTEMRVDTLVKNNGNVHIRPTGKIRITDGKGEEVAGFDIVPGYAILPGGELKLPAFWKDFSLKPGRYGVSVSLDYGKLYEVKKIMNFEKELEIAGNGEVLTR